MNLEGKKFLAPLIGRTSTFLVDGRAANAALARALTSACAQAGLPCRVLDLDAFYSSNAELVFKEIPEEGLDTIFLDVPEPGAGISAHVSRLFGGGDGVIVVDSLNTLHHMLSLNGRGLSFVLAALSAYSRANGIATVVSMYRRERPAGEGRRGSITELADVEIHARLSGGHLVLECVRGQGWPGGPLVVPAT